MTDAEKFDLLKKNILNVDWSMDDAPYHGFTTENIQGVKFAVRKILKGTGITMDDLHEESKTNDWFAPAKQTIDSHKE